MNNFVKKLFSVLSFSQNKKESRLKKFMFKKLNSRTFARILYFNRMYEKVSGLDGDIVECGVGKTRTLQILSFLLEQDPNHKNRKLWGFDSFEGFPEPTKEDASLRNPQKGEWKHIDLVQVYEVLKEVGVSRDFIQKRIKIVKGFFEDTLPKVDIPKISLLHLDVDLYQSYKTCLENLFPKVVRGGVVMFDEYLNEGELLNFPGAKKAIDEYFTGKPYKVEKDPIFGKYYLIKK